MDGVFIIGVDTNVGKTTVAAGIVKMLYGTKNVRYWKPVQTGTIVGDDTNDIKASTDLPAELFLEPAYRFSDPLSPHFAAKKWNKVINTEEMVRTAQAESKKGNYLVVEGAGGLLVPFNETELQVDFLQKMGLPLLIITTDRVGAINQTLLTLNECTRQNLKVHGVIMTKSRGNLGNGEAISSFGKCEVLAQFPTVEESHALIGKVAANPRLRKLFGVQVLPL